MHPSRTAPPTDYVATTSMAAIAAIVATVVVVVSVVFVRERPDFGERLLALERPQSQPAALGPASTSTASSTASDRQVVALFGR